MGNSLIDSAHNHTAPTRHAQPGKDKKTSKEKTPSSYRGRSRELPFCLSLTTREKRGIPESKRYTLLWCQGEVTEVELPSYECATTCPEPVKKNFAGKLGTRQNASIPQKVPLQSICCPCNRTAGMYLPAPVLHPIVYQSGMIDTPPAPNPRGRCTRTTTTVSDPVCPVHSFICSPK